MPILRWFALRGPGAAVRWRWPWPLRKPWRRARLRLCSHGGGIGDELMCTPVFREIRRLNPGCRITFYSRYPEIFARNPHLDKVERFSPDAAAGAIFLRYNVVIPPPRPLVTLMAECVGINMVTERLEPPLVTASPEVRARLQSIPRPLVIIQPQTSQWTPNKQWPMPYWEKLVTLLVEHYDVVEVGTSPAFPGREFGPRFHSFAGGTTMQDFAWIVSQATAFVGSVSGGMHFANAYEIPSVIVFGGYEAPDAIHYPLARHFYTPVDCAPCWLTTACPYGQKCLHAIQPEPVFQAVAKVVESDESRKTAVV